MGSGDKAGTTIAPPVALGEVVVPGNRARRAGSASKTGVNLSSGHAFKHTFMEMGAR